MKKKTATITNGKSFKINDVPYTDTNSFIQTISNVPIVKKRKTEKDERKTISYINLPCAFDIETSSFIDNDGNKTGICYLWQFGVNGSVIYGRTWSELETLINAIQAYLQLSTEKRLVVYVHNLAFEFQWIRKYFEWYDIFALDVREVLYAVTCSGIEFRCSYKLSGYSLADLSNKLTTYHVKKQIGDLNYDLLRHSETPLTSDELRYAIYDVLVVMAYIREKMDVDGNITRLQLTKTGYVRKYCRDCCFYDGKHTHKKNGGKYLQYRNTMLHLTITPDEYKQQKRAFQGGFTHASFLYVDKTVENVDSFDFTSSYPYVMLSEKFPMSSGRLLAPEEWRGKLKHYLSKYCCIFDVEFENIRPRIWYDNIISESKCYKIDGKRVINNGRVVSADLIRLTITEIDLKAYAQFYEWDKMRIANLRIYKRGYLPKEFIYAILKLYGDKTQLKGVTERQTDYLNSKEMLNACYGMTVTDIVRDVISYAEDWGRAPANVEDEITKYNENKRRFLFYAWGIYVTAYARYNLFEGIYNFGDDYIYADTDSIKAKNAEKHMDFINSYNERVREKLRKVSDFYKIPFDLFEPETIKGKKKLIGVWEHETADHKYEKFKTLGAKRYMISGKNVLYDEHKNVYYDLSITVAGVNKFHAVPYLIDKYGIDGAFDAFVAEDDSGLEIPAEHTGKLTHTYIDTEREGYVTDYTGKTAYYKELSSIHLEPVEYSMNKSKEFVRFLKGYKDFVR